MSGEITEGVTQTQERMILDKERTEQNDYGLPLCTYPFPQTRKCPMIMEIWEESNPHGLLVRTENGEA